MKTGFVCASGFNLVATAERDNKRFIAVVLGAPSSRRRAVKAAELLQYGFQSGPAVVFEAVARPGRNAGADRCGAAGPERRNVRPAPPPPGHRGRRSRRRSRQRQQRFRRCYPRHQRRHRPEIFRSCYRRLRAPSPGNLLLDPGPVTPVVVYTGPTRTPDEIAKLEAQIAAEPVKKRAQAKNSGRQAGRTRGGETG